MDLWPAWEPCQTMIIKYPRNMAYLLHAGDNSAILCETPTEETLRAIEWSLDPVELVSIIMYLTPGTLFTDMDEL